MNKRYFLIILLILIGIISGFSNQQAEAQQAPQLEITSFNYPSEASAGSSVNVRVVCQNSDRVPTGPGGAYVVVEWGVAGETIPRGNVCDSGRYVRLSPGESINCSGSFTMPDKNAWVVAILYWYDQANKETSINQSGWITLGGGGSSGGSGGGSSGGSGGGSSGGLGGGSSGGSGGGSTITFNNPLSVGTFNELVEKIADFIFKLALVVVPLLVIIGAFFILTAAGDTRRVETGKKIIFYSLVGLSIILLAKALTNMIKQIMGLKNK